MRSRCGQREGLRLNTMYRLLYIISGYLFISSSKDLNRHTCISILEICAISDLQKNIGTQGLNMARLETSSPLATGSWSPNL